MLEPTSAVGEQGGHPTDSTAALATGGPTLALGRAWATRHRRGLAMLARVAVLVLVVRLFVVPQLGGLRDETALSGLHGGWAPLALGFELGSLVLYTLATTVLLPPRTRPPYQRVARIDLSAIALGHCLPDGGAAGTALSWRLLVADGVPTLDAGLTKAAQGLGSLVVLMVLILGALLVGAVAGGGLSGWSLAPLALSVLVLLVTVLLARSVVSGSAAAGLRAVAVRLPRVGPRVAAGLDGLAERDVVRHLRGLLRRPERFSVAAGFSGGNWALDALTLYACLRAFGPGVGLQGLAVVYAIQAVGTWLPVTPSGLGLSESLMIPALVAFGAPQADAVLGILTWRLFAYWLPIPLGALAYASLGRRRAAPALVTTAS